MSEEKNEYNDPILEHDYIRSFFHIDDVTKFKDDGNITFIIERNIEGKEELKTNTKSFLKKVTEDSLKSTLKFLSAAIHLENNNYNYTNLENIDLENVFRSDDMEKDNYLDFLDIIVDKHVSKESKGVFKISYLTPGMIGQQYIGIGNSNISKMLMDFQSQSIKDVKPDVLATLDTSNNVENQLLKSLVSLLINQLQQSVSCNKDSMQNLVRMYKNVTDDNIENITEQIYNNKNESNETK